MFGKREEMGCLPDGKMLRKFEAAICVATAARRKGSRSRCPPRRSFDDEVTSVIEIVLSVNAASMVEL